MADTVKMERDGKTADIHPDEVENCKRCGWVLVAKPKPVAKKRAAKKWL